MKNVAELQSDIEQLTAKAAAIVQLARDEKRDLLKDEEAEIDRIQGAGDSKGEIGKLEAQLARAEKLEALMAEKAINKASNAPREGQPVIKVKPVVGNLKSFKGPTAEEDAWITGHFLAASLRGNSKSAEWLNSRGIQIQNAMSTGDNEKGGFLLPTQTASTIIRLVEDYGVFRRQIGMVWPVTSGQMYVPKRASGLTVYHPGENKEITDSDIGLSNVELVPHKAAVLTRMPNELPEDAMPIIADLLIREIATAFAYDEDNAAFNGDGTNAFNRVTGLLNALAAGSVYTATGQTSFAALTMSSFQGAMAQYIPYAGANPEWYISHAGYHQSMARLKVAGGGNTISDIQAGTRPEFLGYPVNITQVLPGGLGTTAQTVAYFGDLSFGCAMGDARALTIMQSEHRYFEYDQIGVRATNRWDIQVHGRGTATTGGPVIALKLG